MFTNQGRFGKSTLIMMFWILLTAVIGTQIHTFYKLDPALWGVWVVSL